MDDTSSDRHGTTANRSAPPAGLAGTPEIVFVEIDGAAPEDLAVAPLEPTAIGELARHVADHARASVHARHEELVAQRRALELARLSAKPRPHAGVGLDRPRRTGHLEEVIVTLASPPSVVRRAAVGDALHSVPVQRLTIDHTSRSIRPREVRWRAQLRTGLLRRRGATLRFYTSPSTNVSVLSLVPLRPHRVYTGAFIRAGLRALNEMSARLDAAAAAQSSLNNG